MRIGRSKVEKHEYTLKADLKPMEETIAEKDVGVTIDNKLSFDIHITKKVNKANSIIGLGVIRSTFEYLDLKTFRMLYVSLVRPHLEYANPVSVIDFSSGPVAHGQWKLIRTSDFCQKFSIESI